MTRNSEGGPVRSDGRRQTTRLPIATLNCPWNGRRIVDAIKRMDGVVEASLPRSDTVVVRHDPTRVAESAITAAVERPASTTERDTARSRSGRRSGGCQCRCHGRRE